MGLDSSALPRVATAFGGGIGGSGGPCGALVGAAMAVSLMRGQKFPEEERRRVYDLVQPVFNAFEKDMGSILCRQLTGLDLRTPEGIAQLRASDVHTRVCRRAVELGERLGLEAGEQAGH